MNRTIETAVDPHVETFISNPNFAGKKHHHESFDGLLLAEDKCVVFECKGGFLSGSAKYADNLEAYVTELDKKFGSGERAGIEQLTRKISEVFAGRPSERRSVENANLTAVKTIIPVLVVQDGFVSSLFTTPWPAKTFRDQMRKIADLDRRVVLTSLLVLHVEDVETLAAYAKSGVISLTQCLADISQMGDPRPGRLFSFDIAFRSYLGDRRVSGVRAGALDKQFVELLDRLCLRIFGHRFNTDEQPH
ncbi:MAG: hypothetical protein WA673_06890 [Candidatus Acidiferrales bacterium]